jgi:siroheme synthase-like protein
MDLGYFPFFMDIKDKLCLVVGGGKVAHRKISTLLQFGAQIKVVSIEVNDDIKELEKNSLLEILRSEYHERFLEGAFLVIVATNNRDINEKVAMDAHTKGVFSNVADSQEDSDFLFPAIVKRGEIVIGITTSGGYPALGSHIKKHVESMLPDYFEKVLEELKEYREEVLADCIDINQKKECLHNKLKEKIDEIVCREWGNNEKKD